MRAKVQRFGKSGLHIYIPRSSGYTQGEEVEISQSKDSIAPITRAEIKSMIEAEIEKAKHGY